MKARTQKSQEYFQDRKPGKAFFNPDFKTTSFRFHSVFFFLIFRKAPVRCVLRLFPKFAFVKVERFTSFLFTYVMFLTNFSASMVVVNEFIFSNILVCNINLLHKKKRLQHLDFPSGHPP